MTMDKDKMTQELIHSYYEAFNRGDMETFLSLLTENVIHDLNQGQREVGRKAFGKFMEVMNEHYQEKVVDLVIFVSHDGQRAAAEFIIEGCYLKTQEGLPLALGQKYRLPVGAFFAIEGNKISRITNYYNLKDWIEQVSVP